MKQRIFLPLIVLLFFVISCSSDYTQKMKQSETDFYSGKYLDAARSLLPAINKKNNDQLLLMMEAGLMLHTGSEFEKSNSVFLSAGDLAEKIALSISKEAASLLVNDTVTNYRGEDFEVVLLHMYTGINFLMINKPEEARVEFKKVDNLLRGIKESGGLGYKQNLMAKYLYAIAFELSAQEMNDENDYNDAYVEYKQIFARDPAFEDVKIDLLRMAKKIGDDEDYAMWSSRFGTLDKRIPNDSGELVLIYQAGQSAVKRSRGKILDDPQMKGAIQVSFNSMPAKEGVALAGVFVALALAENPIPKFVKRSNKVATIQISGQGVKNSSTHLLEDIENTAVKNLEEKYSSMFMKAAAQVTTKVVVSLAAGYAAKKAAEQIGGTIGQFSGLIGAATGAGVGAGLASTIRPDLRCWHTLPANLQMKRFFLKPGTYELNVALQGSNGQTIQTDTQTVEIVSGKKTLLNYRTLF